MKTKKSRLQHELLNIFTLMNCYLYDDELGSEERHEIMELIKCASLLIGYENLFLNKKVPFLYQMISLNEFLEVITLSHEREIREKNIDIQFPENDVVLSMDRHYIREALTQIVAKLLPTTSRLHYEFNGKTNTLSIEYDGNPLDIGERKPLIEYLNQKDTGEKMPLQLGLTILDRYGASLQLTEGRIEIQLPEDGR